jgi:hypothetical protein
VLENVVPGEALALELTRGGKHLSLTVVVRTATLAVEAA